MNKPFAARSDPEARRAYTRWHYRQNKELYKARAVKHRIETKVRVRAFLTDYLLAHPCIDCGESDIIVLQFDHRNGSAKKFNIGEAIRRCVSVETLKVEVAKCDVRCANCHQRKTYKERGHTHRDH